MDFTLFYCDYINYCYISIIINSLKWNIDNCRAYGKIMQSPIYYYEMGVIFGARSMKWQQLLDYYNGPQETVVTQCATLSFNNIGESKSIKEIRVDKK